MAIVTKHVVAFVAKHFMAIVALQVTKSQCSPGSRYEASEPQCSISCRKEQYQLQKHEERQPQGVGTI